MALLDNAAESHNLAIDEVNMMYPARHDDAVSEVIGSILLVSLVVIGVAIAAAVLWSQPPAQKIPEFSASISNSSCSVILSHTGGETVTNSTLRLLVDGTDLTNNFIKQGTTGPWSLWGIGETLEYTPSYPCILTPKRVDIVYSSGSVSSSVSTGFFENPVSAGVAARVPGAPMVPDFSGTPTAGFVPFTVQFTDTSSGPPISWSWAFGDGGTSTLQSPSHTYTSAQSYTVSLTVNNGTGTSTLTKTNYITASRPLIAEFTSDTQSGIRPLAVQFTDQSLGSPVSWSWVFGDGGTSTAQSPAYTYLRHGRYSVILTVTNASAGTNSTTKTNYITVTPTPPWYSCSWGYRKNITIDKSRVSGAQTDFPVLINLASDNDLKTSARTDGYDILFTSSDGTKLPHEIESYRSGTGALVAWVKVPSVTSSSNTTIYMYYGYPSSTDQQNKNNVWDTNYKAVWHLNETGTGTRFDSTINANNANPRNYDGNEATTGKIGGADYFEGTNDYLDSSNTIGITGNAVRTITFWANLGNTNRNGMVVWGTNVANSQFGASVRNTHYFLWGYGGGNDWDTGIIPATASWHHHAVINDGTTGRWYVDGSQLSSGFAHTYATTNSIVTIGREVDGATISYMLGTIDEVRISDSARSTSWITTEYNNQNSPATFHYLGNQEQWTC